MGSLLCASKLVVSKRMVAVHQHAHSGSRGDHVTQKSQALTFQPCGEEVNAGHVAAWPVDGLNETKFDRIVTGAEHDGSCSGAILENLRRLSGSDNHGGPTTEQIGSEGWQTIHLAISPAILNRKMAAFEKIRVGKAATHRRREMTKRIARADVEEADHRQR